MTARDVYLKAMKTDPQFRIAKKRRKKGVIMLGARPATDQQTKAAKAAQQKEQPK